MKLFELIIPESQKIDSVMRADLVKITQDTDDLLNEVLEYSLFSGGKKVRPMLAILSARLFGEHGEQSLYNLAIAFEYLHVATLLHDDVIDNGDYRRGKPTVHRKYGMIPAILAGDFLHSRSMELMARYGSGELLDIFCEATQGMVDGEFVQLRNASNFNQSVDQYFEGIIGKTALLIGAATEIGCCYGGGNKTDREAFRQYGINLGCAFQIIDDLLDYQGNEKKTGKSVGNDLAEGKITLPLIYALNRVSSDEKSRFMEILASKEKRIQAFADIYELIASRNGFVDSRKKAQKLIDQALDHLAPYKSRCDSHTFFILEELAHYVLTREK